MNFERRRRLKISGEIASKNRGSIPIHQELGIPNIPVNKNRAVSCFPPLKNSRNRNIVNEWGKIHDDGPIVISFISDPVGSNFYSSRINELVKKIDFFGLNYLIRQYESDRDYFQNCCFKPAFIQEIMEKFQRDVVWIDGDTHLKDTLISFFNSTQEFDLGLVSYSDDISGFVASPIFVRNTEESIKFIASWAEHCTEKVETGHPELDHDAIKHSIIPQFRTTLKIKLSGSDFHSGRVLENVNSEAPNKKLVMDMMRDVNQYRPFNYSNKDFIII